MTDETDLIPIEDLMDSSIDDLEELPPFIVPPVGYYKLAVSLSRKSVNDKPCIEAAFVVRETLELKNPSEAPCEAGTKFSQLFTMDNEWGQKGFKSFLKGLIDPLGLSGKKVSEVIEAVQNVEVAATVKQRKDKNDPDKIYANVSDATVM